MNDEGNMSLSSYAPVSSSFVAFHEIMGDDDAHEPNGSWSDIYDAGIYALECGEFEEAMEHWSDMFECIPSDRIPVVTAGLTAIISDHLRMKVDSAPDCIELDGIDEMAVCRAGGYGRKEDARHGR